MPKGRPALRVARLNGVCGLRALPMEEPLAAMSRLASIRCATQRI